MTQAYATKTLEVQVEIDPRATVRVRKGVLEIVLANLVGNAFQHAGAGVLRITYHQRRLTISDSGGGAPRDSTAGLGRGLSIVRRVCEHHQITFDTQHESAGTTVHLEFPR
ncbi:MAG: ATP-binding protein [Myxococcota bacterium]